jgi:AcrR family transcriptional regulator
MSKEADLEGRILRAAAEEFKRCGLAAARSDRFAFSAGLSDKEMIFNLFGDKHRLFDATVEMGLISPHAGGSPATERYPLPPRSRPPGQ